MLAVGTIKRPSPAPKPVAITRLCSSGLGLSANLRAPDLLPARIQAIKHAGTAANIDGVVHNHGCGLKTAISGKAPHLLPVLDCNKRPVLEK